MACAAPSGTRMSLGQQRVTHVTQVTQVTQVTHVTHVTRTQLPQLTSTPGDHLPATA